MSFILDALKKSESDRQRQRGPGLFEGKLAPPRTALPTWAIAVGALLLVNLGVVMWMLLRHSTARAPEAPPVAAARVSAAPRPAPAPATTAQPALASQPALVPATLPAAPVAAAGGGAATTPV